jgi:nitroimidazol reductase NimA-like FMN-containing flavoprotein (pyridoxamine 5'-phosphate oxidase superfamily)
MARLAVTERTRPRRRPERVAHETDAIHAVLDAGLVCHVGFEHEGQPYVIPTTYARVGDALYVHGSAASRMLRRLADGVPVCVAVTLVDGLVLARSAFHHSMNYRSVVIFGRAGLVVDPDEQRRALRAIVDRLAPGRWDEVRAPTAKELRATAVLRLPIVEASVKVRTGGPIDDPEDVALPCWAGHVPLRLVALAPVRDAGVAPGASAPGTIADGGVGA